MQKEYEVLVEEAKRLLANRISYKYRVAAIALTICDIKGSEHQGSKYALTQFAEDIGVPHRTLSRWVHIYRDILLSTGIENPSAEQWKRANKTSLTLKAKRSVFNRSVGNPGARDFKVIPKEIAQEFERSNSKMSDLAYRQERILTSSQNLKFNFERVDLLLCDPELLEQVYDNLSYVMLQLMTQLYASSKKGQSSLLLN